MNIRQAQPEDAQRLLEIYDYYVRCTAITYEYETPSLEDFRERIEKTLQRYPYLVIEEEGQIQGYTYAGPFKDRAAYDWSCELSIYLDRTAQGKGMGRRLYEALEEELRGMGILNLYACIALPEREDEYLTKASADFHTHLGFKEVGRYVQCASKFGRWYHMVWMEKKIGEHLDHQPGVRWYAADGR